MSIRHPLFAAILAAVFTLLLGCGDKSSDSTAAPAEEPETVSDTTEPAALPRSPSVEGASVFFITPKDGDTVSNPIKVEFGIEGMSVVKAGDNSTLR